MSGTELAYSVGGRGLGGNMGRCVLTLRHTLTPEVQQACFKISYFL